MAKSALPIGTTPHRRKKAATKKSTVDDADYCFGDDAAATPARATSKSRADMTVSKARPKSGGIDTTNAVKKSSSSHTEKENTHNGSRKSRDASLDELNKSMAQVSISTNENKQSSRPKHEIRHVKLPSFDFPAINSKSTTASLSESIKHLKDVDTKSLSASLVTTIQKSSIKPTASITLEENSSQIKHVMKQCLKSPTLHSLRVVVHSLRAIMGIIDKGTGVKLAFHACVLSGEGMMKSLDNKAYDQVGEYGLLTLAAYQCLGRLVRGSKFTWDDDVFVEGKKEILPRRQMIKICVDGGIAASSAFMHLGLLSMRGVGIENEFGLDLSGDFQSILQTVLPLVLEMEEEWSKFAKRIFRFLWDGARCVDDIRIGLHIQCLAVATLTQYCVDAFPVADKEQRKELYSLWDRAASSALKAVAVFDKQINNEEMQNRLIEFHDVAGPMLDNAWIQFIKNTEKRLGPPAYYEYCVYRSIHSWKFRGSLESIHVPDDLLRVNGCKYSSSDLEALSAMASFSVIILALQARNALDGYESMTSLPSCDAVLSNFDKVTRSASQTGQMRCRSMVMMLNLQREATKMIASSRRESNQGRALAILGYVLGRCMAPLETRISSSTEDNHRSQSICLSASDNHAKAASLLDAALNDTSVSSKTIEKWNAECARQIRKGFEILSPLVAVKDDIETGSPTVLAVEMFAKTAASVGKNMSDRKDTTSAIECQLYSLDLLTKVAAKAPSHASFDKYQISTRYMLLASTLRSHGNTEGSCASLALAVWGAAKRNVLCLNEGCDESESFIGDIVSEELLLFPGAATIDQPDSNTGTIADGMAIPINKLARACIEATSFTRPNVSTPLPQDTVLAKLLETAISEKQLSIQRLLDYIVWENGEFSINEALELTRELLKCMSNVLKCHASSDSHAHEITQAILKQLNDFTCLQIDRLAKLVPTEDFQVIASALHVSSAMYAVDSQLLRFPKPHAYQSVNKDAKSEPQNVMLECSLTQFQQADKLFDNATGDCCQDTCFYVQWAAVLLHQSIVFEHRSLLRHRSTQSGAFSRTPMDQYNRTLGICGQAMQQLSNTEEEVPVQVIESLIATTKRLLCRFSLHGDPVLSSKCFVYLQKLYNFDQQSEHAFESISDLLWISSKFDDLAVVLFQNCKFDPASAKSSLDAEVQQLTEEEQLDVVSNYIVDLMAAISQHCSASQCESLINGTEESLANIAEFIKVYLNRIENDDDEMESTMMYAQSEVVVQIQSLVITFLMLRAKLFLNAKQPESSILCFNACRVECKRMISLLKLSSKYLQNPEDKLLQVDDLLSMGLERISIAFSSLGIRRKSEDNAILAVIKQKMACIENPSMSKITLLDLIASIQSLDGMYNYLPSLRTLISIKSLSLPPDKFCMDSAVFVELSPNTPQDTSVTDGVNRSRTLLAYNDSFRYAPDFKSQCDTFLSLAHQSIADLMDQSAETCTDVPLASFVHPTEQEVRLRMIAQEKDKSDAASVLESIAQSSTRTSCLAEAYFELGMSALEKAKSDNELHSLWKDHSVSSNKSELDTDCVDLNESSLPFTSQARKYFNCALSHAHPASNYITKKILRSLALVTGPETLSAFLINASVGGTSRNIVRDAIHSSSRLHKLFNVFDDEFSNVESRSDEFATLLNEYSSMIPSSWSISAIAICPTGDMLITSFRAFGHGEQSIKTICILTSGDEFHRSILHPLDQIIERSQKQLRGIDEEKQSEKYNDESSKRKWWDERHSINEDLRSLLQAAQNQYFGHDLVRQILASTCAAMPHSDDDSSEYSDFGPGNLASRFEAAEREPAPEFDEDSERLALKKMTVVYLKEKLNSFGIGGSKVQKMRKADLIDLLITEMANGIQSNQAASEDRMEIDERTAVILSSSSSPNRASEEPCSILILDEHLHRLPLESMDMFENTAVTRMPSLSFVLAALYERQLVDSNIDPNQVKFIIDPEKNLSETASKMKLALNTLSSENDWEWNGCVGEMPTSEFMSEALTEESGLLLYCGHGAGEKFFTRSQVEDFINFHDNDKSDRLRGCSSAIVLMGCSSGKLKSVNCPKETTGDIVYPIHYEPEGIASSYIFAGAPCVVGNLWDVTDRDIDRYCLTLLQDFFSHPNENSPAPSLAKCVALARRACKLRYIVGSAPVCYGLPVHIKSQNDA